MRLALARGALVTVALLSLSLVGCSKKGGGPPNAPAPPATPDVTVSNSSPASGDGTLGNRTVGLTGVAPKVVTIRGTVNGKQHRIDVTFDPATSAVSNVTHRWGDNIGPGGTPDAITNCDAAGSPCNSAKVSVNQDDKKVTFTNLVLTDGGAATSTLNGFEIYP